MKLYGCRSRGSKAHHTYGRTFLHPLYSATCIDCAKKI